MLKSYCNNCGGSKEPANYSAINCAGCETLSKEAQQAFAAEHKDASESDILYAGRMALTQRAHHAHRNFLDPRQFSAGRGMIPIPPPDKRGSTS